VLIVGRAAAELTPVDISKALIPQTKDELKAKQTQVKKQVDEAELRRRRLLQERIAERKRKEAEEDEKARAHCCETSNGARADAEAHSSKATANAAEQKRIQLLRERMAQRRKTDEEADLQARIEAARLRGDQVQSQSPIASSAMPDKTLLSSIVGRPAWFVD
jgi:hypothetical protein